MISLFYKWEILHPAGSWQESYKKTAGDLAFTARHTVQLHAIFSFHLFLFSISYSSVLPQ